MAQLGQINHLKIVRKVDFGFYLDGENLGEILMPKRYIFPDMKIGDTIDVMVYLDGEERLLATTEIPFAQVGDFAYLKVNKIENVGAFLDWGLSKELLVPFSEQKVKMEEGKSYVVHVYIDKITDRITGSMKLEKFINKEKPEYTINQEVDLLIWTLTDVGYKAIINNQHIGVIYKNEIFRKISNGQKMNGYIKKIRDDDKIDLTLDKIGYTKIDSFAQLILNAIEKSGGFLPYNDKTDPEIIYNIFGMSKKVFKQSIGNLFKQRYIEITPEGIKKLS
ncbi:MAG: GntR family transcriptional regulator [Saprospiraceae bacterium]|nr:GntR family transcriptional regulator [Saprospiraceae bacterium]MBP6567365.1 GntR family transcriptional regulator [Saprospiraceae bacterium]